jgi:hypothetical protein
MFELRIHKHTQHKQCLAPVLETSNSADMEKSDIPITQIGTKLYGYAGSPASQASGQAPARPSRPPGGSLCAHWGPGRKGLKHLHTHARGWDPARHYIREIWTTHVRGKAILQPQSFCKRGSKQSTWSRRASFRHAQHDPKHPNLHAFSIIACCSTDGADSGTCSCSWGPTPIKILKSF